MSELTDLLGSLSTQLASHPTLLDSVVAVVAAFVFSQVLAWVYERTYRGLSYSTNVTHTLVLSSIAAALVILAMKHSLVAGLGLLAALSMIRFRTTLKAPKDLVYIMASVTLGIACGAQALIPATVGCAAFALASLYLHVVPIGAGISYDGVLRFRTAPDGDLEPRLGELLATHCRRHVLLTVGEVAQGSRLEHAYQVKFRGEGDRMALIRSLRRDLAADDARLLMQESTLEF